MILLFLFDFQIMRTLPLNTRQEVEKFLISLLPNTNTAQKFAQIRSLSQTTIQLSRRAIARANQDLSDEQMDLRFITLHYGKELADNVKNYLDRKS